MSAISLSRRARFCAMLDAMRMALRTEISLFSYQFFLAKRVPHNPSDKKLCLGLGGDPCGLCSTSDTNKYFFSSRLSTGKSMDLCTGVQLTSNFADPAARRGGTRRCEGCAEGAGLVCPRPSPCRGQKQDRDVRDLQMRWTVAPASRACC